MKAWLGLTALVATVLSVAACAEDSVIDLGHGGATTTTGTGNTGNVPLGGGGAGASAGFGATGGNGATGGAGATGGTGGQPPDCNVGDCSDCALSNCATDACVDEYTTCDDNPDCFPLADCEFDCGVDPDCITACYTEYADGQEDYYALLNCLYCGTDTCATDCAAYCPWEPPPTGACDSGSCGTCADSDCAYFWCGPEGDACFESPECEDFTDCYYACTTPDCDYACHQDHAAGATLYYALLNCLYCSTDTCAGDCADLCPIAPPTDNPCDTGGTCNECANGDCAWFWCGPAVDACYDSDECNAFMDCYYAATCTTPECEYACHEDNAAGATLYYEMLNCVYCSTDTCSVDCVDYCPIEPPTDSPCDTGGSCNECGQSDCAWFWCDAAVDACYDSAECNAFMDCYYAPTCTTPECEYACHEDHAAGATLYYEMLNCVYCSTDTCSADCVDACPVEPPPASPCNVGDCSNCGNSDCAWFWCGTEVNACFDSAECEAFMDCYYACTDVDCEYACHQDNAAGATLYYAMMNCVYCGTDTCFADCDAEGACPIEQPPAPPCDAGGTCDECVASDCAYYWCTPEFDACFADQDCNDFIDCYYACTDAACDQACVDAHPTGFDLYLTAIDCLYCNPDTCSQDCVVECAGTTGCDVGDCNTCFNSQCAWDACDAEATACDAVPQCWSYVNCALACTNNGCFNNCRNQFPAGEAPGQAIVNCLACSPSTCSQDCAPVCPWP